MEDFKGYNEGVEQRKELEQAANLCPKDTSVVLEKPEDHPGCYVATNMLTNLCESCNQCIADCGNEVIQFGYGVGQDNVVKCNCYDGPDSCDIKYCSL